MSWEPIFAALTDKKDLSNEQITWGMSQISQDSASNKEIKAFLTGLRIKGESAQEVLALVTQMNKDCVPINITERVVDIGATGAEGAENINISTIAAIITNAAGARVLRHGSRAANSKSGSVDLLEALGVRPDLTGVEVEQTVHKIGLGFCFAPIFHAAIRNAESAGKELGFPNILNILEPLINPARPAAVAIGVAPTNLSGVFAQVLVDQGREGFIFNGDDGLDWVSLATTTTVIQISKSGLKQQSFNPDDLGIAQAPIEELLGTGLRENAERTNQIFSGKTGAMRDLATLNAAFAIAAFKGDFDLPLGTQIANGFVLANKAIDSGAAKAVLKRWVELSNEIVSAR